MVNGDFEDGPVSWTEYSSNGWDLILNESDLQGIDAHRGSWAAWLGGEYYEVSYVEQKVTIPSTKPYLAYWHWIDSNYNCGLDYGGVIIDRSTVVDEYSLCGSSDTGGWQKHVVDLRAYKGKTVRLQIRAETAQIYPFYYSASNLFVDDVAFQSSSSAVTRAEPLEAPNEGAPRSKPVGLQKRQNAEQSVRMLGDEP